MSDLTPGLNAEIEIGHARGKEVNAGRKSFTCRTSLMPLVTSS